MISYGRQSINQQDIEAVIDVLKSDYLTQGPVVPEFELSVCKAVGARYSIAVNSATSALHIACLALGLRKEDVVWTSPISFVASANCALYCGAGIDFVDIEEDTHNLSVEKLSDKLLFHKNNNLPLPKIIIPVHLAGHSCDMEKIGKLSKEYGFYIIEDASHAIGGSYQGEPIGSGRYSDITVFSFHPVKIITTAEGGMATTNDNDIAKKMRLLRSHGVTRDKSELEMKNSASWYYEQQLLGFNYRLTDIQAALGLSQMDRLGEFIEDRKIIANNYLDELHHLPIDLPIKDVKCQSSWHLFIIKLRIENTSKTRHQVFNELRKRGVGVNLHYIPIYKQPYYQKMGFDSQYCVTAEDYYKAAISIPIYHGLSGFDQNSVIKAVCEVLE
ncbi:MAG: UDP-4-amino-4,6-dideoxy-N-acetyl-beta-L-altrosamine transaminase [Colwellia sp.]|jgi:UDP-4-keto-6-deoxy-N-acetylglucosamine 4-aminotransferase